MLLESGARNIRDCVGQCPLHIHIKKENIVRLLLEYGANTNCKTRIGETPLSLALIDGCSAATILVLLDHGADPRVEIKKGWTALHEAMKRKNGRIISKMIASGADVEAEAHTGKTPLQMMRYLTKNQQGLIRPLLKKQRLSQSSWGSLSNKNTFEHEIWSQVSNEYMPSSTGVYV